MNKHPIKINLPDFTSVHTDKIEQQLDQKLSNYEEKLNELLILESYDFSSLIGAIEDYDVLLQNFWGPISHFTSVNNQDEMRAPYENGLQKLTEFNIKLGQNENLYKKIKKLKEDSSYVRLNKNQQKIIDDMLLDFKLSGISLEEKQKKVFSTIQKKLNQSETEFSNHVLDATDSWQLEINDINELEGVPASTLQSMKNRALAENKKGWLITLDFPTYYGVMSNAKNRDLRQIVYQAYITRASDQSPTHPQYDNTQLMSEILGLRNETAKLLNFKSYAELSLVKKMAKKSNKVFDLLNELGDKALTRARNEWEELQAFAKKYLNLEKLNPWDVAFAAEAMRRHLFAFDDEQLRNYFPIAKVRAGLFQILKTLFGIEFRRNTEQDKKLWSSEAEFYEIYSANGECIGGILFDLIARPKKRGGAWMDSCLVRHRFQDGSLQLPVAYVNCNFAKNHATEGSLLTHEEVQTLFHEVGHALHHVLTEQEIARISGINSVPWDGVELPSQFLENFSWDPEVLQLISQNIETHETLPADLLDKMLAAKNFQSAMQMVRQIEFSLFDFRIHNELQEFTSEKIQMILDDVRKKVSVVPIVPYNRFQHSFTHVFAGGYAAGYYSYKWAEVLSADAFSRFKQEGVLNAQLGQEFKQTILASGGSGDFLQHFIEFMGREPKVDSLLLQEGIIG